MRLPPVKFGPGDDNAEAMLLAGLTQQFERLERASIITAKDEALALAKLHQTVIVNLLLRVASLEGRKP